MPASNKYNQTKEILLRFPSDMANDVFAILRYAAARMTATITYIRAALALAPTHLLALVDSQPILQLHHQRWPCCAHGLLCWTDVLESTCHARAGAIFWCISFTTHPVDALVVAVSGTHLQVWRHGDIEECCIAVDTVGCASMWHSCERAVANIVKRDRPWWEKVYVVL